MSQASAIFNNSTLIYKLKQLLMNASDCILDIYNLPNLDITIKSDNSPVTKADIAAHTLLFNGLSSLTPTIPIISEEDNESLSISRSHSTYWLIDPLDGTKEFISRNGEFTVNVALIEDNKPSLGFVCVPTKKTLYWGGANYGSFKSIPLLLSNFVCSSLENSPSSPANSQNVLSGTIPHLEFSIEIQSNNLTYQGNPYTKYQQFLYVLIKSLHDKGYGYRRIAHKLNKWNVKTTRGNTWYNTSVSSVLKRKHERDVRIQEIRNQEYPIKIGKFAIKYYIYRRI